MLRGTSLAVSLLLPVALAAQPPGPDPAQLEAMGKLAFLVGTWKGEGVTRFGPNESRATGTETAQVKQGGLALLVEGKFSAKIPDADREVVVHDALAVIGYDPAARKYLVHAFRNGLHVPAELKLTDNGFEWGFRDPQRKTHVRFAMTLSEAGEWVEKGYFSRDGENWTEFMEMRLKKADD